MGLRNVVIFSVLTVILLSSAQLTVVAKGNTIEVWTLPWWRDFWETVILEFEENYPWVRVELTCFPYEELFYNFIVAITTGAELPDVVTLTVEQAYDLLMEGVLEGHLLEEEVEYLESQEVEVAYALPEGEGEYYKVDERWRRAVGIEFNPEIKLVVPRPTYEYSLSEREGLIHLLEQVGRYVPSTRLDTVIDGIELDLLGELTEFMEYEGESSYCYFLYVIVRAKAALEEVRQELEIANPKALSEDEINYLIGVLEKHGHSLIEYLYDWPYSADSFLTEYKAFLSDLFHHSPDFLSKIKLWAGRVQRAVGHIVGEAIGVIKVAVKETTEAAEEAARWVGKQATEAYKLAAPFIAKYGKKAWEKVKAFWKAPAKGPARPGLAIMVVTLIFEYANDLYYSYVPCLKEYSPTSSKFWECVNEKLRKRGLGENIIGRITHIAKTIGAGFLASTITSILTGDPPGASSTAKDSGLLQVHTPL